MMGKSYNEGKKGIGRFAWMFAWSLTIGLHLFLIYFWLTLTRPAALPKTAPVALTVLLIPPQKNANATVKIPVPVHVMPPTSQARTVKKPSTATSIGTPSPAKIVAPTENAITLDVEKKDASSSAESDAKRVDTMILNAKRDIGKIDQELRKAYPTLSNPTPDTAQSRFEKALAAAAKPRSLTTEAYTLADGRKMTKVIGPAGTYCISTELAHGSDGIDHLQNGMKTRTTTCPN